MKKISIIIPVFNEIKTIKDVLKEIENVRLPGFRKEIIIVDDCSTDGTTEFLRKLNGYKIFFHSSNLGKTAAIKTALNYASGEYVIIQDADMEYSPKEYLKILEKAQKEDADIVYGSRFLKKGAEHKYYTLYLGNIMLSSLASILFGTKVTDIETCYKLFKTKVLKSVEIKSKGFGFEAEITAKVLKQGYKIHEVPISYRSRPYSEGKKIKAMDGVKAALILLKYWII